MAWEVHANDDYGSEHMAQFHNKNSAQRHFLDCLAEYGSATPPYEIDDEDVLFWEDE